LLKNKIFTKHRVDVSEWIYSQLLQAEEPLHPLLPALLEEWVKKYTYIPPSPFFPKKLNFYQQIFSILTPSASFCMKRLSTSKILQVFIREEQQKQQQRQNEKGKEKMDIEIVPITKGNNNFAFPRMAFVCNNNTDHF